jgi:hypothetical protein
MARYDRLHARPPTHDAERWSRGTVVGVAHEPGGVVVTVDAEGPAGPRLDLRVSEAVYELFVGRVDENHRTGEGEVRPGAPVWFRARGN